MYTLCSRNYSTETRNKLVTTQNVLWISNMMRNDYNALDINNIAVLRFCKVMPKAGTTGFFHYYIPWTYLPHTLKSYPGFPFLSFFLPASLLITVTGFTERMFFRGFTEIRGLFPAVLAPSTSKCKEIVQGIKPKHC